MTAAEYTMCCGYLDEIDNILRAEVAALKDHSMQTAYWVAFGVITGVLDRCHPTDGKEYD